MKRDENVKLRYSIRFRVMCFFAALLCMLLVIILVLNTFAAEPFYMSKKRSNMMNAYGSISSVLTDYVAGSVTKDEMTSKIDSIVSVESVDVLVVDSSWMVLYHNSRDDKEMLMRLRADIFNNDLYTPVDKTEEKDGSRQSAPEGVEKPDTNGAFSMRGSGVTENREILEESSEYTLAKIYDENRAGEYYELWGTCGNGTSMIIRVPLEAIHDNVQITNRFIKFGGLLVLIGGGICSFIFSGFIARPIKKLCALSQRMSRLDFNAKYEGKDQGEIGMLGESMNEMSKSLESNIAQLKSANAELKRDIDRKVAIDDMRKEFLSNVSHELKTPIALIQGYAEGLKDGITDNPESMNYYCDVIIDEAQKMNAMVKKLLTLNQIEFGNEELVFERFSLTELVSSVASANQLRASQKGITLSFEQPKDAYDVWCDEYKIEEVITNYISNAINHCTGVKKIRIWITEEGENYRVHVFNTGKPIPDEDLDKIWIKFYKVDKARTREYGGNGIGLSIVKAILDSYGRDCGVFNHDDGVEFWFELDRTNKG